MTNDVESKSPKRMRTVLTGIGVTLASGALIAGSFFVVTTTTEASEQAAADRVAAQELYDAAAEQQSLANAAAEDAAINALRAEEAVTVAEAKEAAKLAKIAATKAAEAFTPEPPQTTNLPSGATPPNIAGTDQPDSTACASSALVWNGSKSVCA